MHAELAQFVEQPVRRLPGDVGGDDRAVGGLRAGDRHDSGVTVERVVDLLAEIGRAHDPQVEHGHGSARPIRRRHRHRVARRALPDWDP